MIVCSLAILKVGVAAVTCSYQDVLFTLNTSTSIHILTFVDNLLMIQMASLPWLYHQPQHFKKQVVHKVASVVPFDSSPPLGFTTHLPPSRQTSPPNMNSQCTQVINIDSLDWWKFPRLIHSQQTSPLSNQYWLAVTWQLWWKLLMLIPKIDRWHAMKCNFWTHWWQGGQKSGYRQCPST